MESMAETSNTAVLSKTAVFWDMVDCQIPDGLNAVVVSQNIRSALEKLGYRGTSSIYAYGDMNQIKAGLENTRFVVKQHKRAEEAHKEYLGTTSICDTEDLESPGIVVNDTPSGDKHARLEKIILDSFFWALDNPAPANLMFILGDISSDDVFISALYNLDAAKYKVLLAQPAFPSKATAVARAKWFWEVLSAGGDHIVDDQTESDDATSDESAGEDHTVDDNESDDATSDEVLSAGGDHTVDDNERDDATSDDASLCSRMPKQIFAAGILASALIDLSAGGSRRIPVGLLSVGSLVCTVIAYFLDR